MQIHESAGMAVVPESIYINIGRFQGRILCRIELSLSKKVKEKDIFVSPSTKKRYW